MATNLSNLASFLGDGTSHTTKNSPSPHTFPTTVKDILRAAEELYIPTEPLDIARVAREIFQIEVREEDFGRSVSGFLERIGPNWYIYINSYESKFRKRFTIAHELAHFVLHKDKYILSGKSEPDQIFFRDSNTSSIEKEANAFAAELLMPKESFVSAIQAGNNTLEKLSSIFQLSTSAIKYRAYKLGLLSEY